MYAVCRSYRIVSYRFVSNEVRIVLDSSRLNVDQPFTLDSIWGDEWMAHESMHDTWSIHYDTCYMIRHDTTDWTTVQLQLQLSHEEHYTGLDSLNVIKSLISRCCRSLVYIWRDLVCTFVRLYVSLYATSTRFIFCNLSHTSFILTPRKRTRKRTRKRKPTDFHHTRIQTSPPSTILSTILETIPTIMARSRLQNHYHWTLAYVCHYHYGTSYWFVTRHHLLCSNCCKLCSEWWC